MKWKFDLQEIVDRYQSWAVWGMVVVFLGLVGFSLLPQDIHSVVLVDETKKTAPPVELDGHTAAISLEQKSNREPASATGPELRLNVQAIAEAVGPDFKKLEEKKCLKDPTCQLDGKAIDIYVKIKNSRSSVEHEDYRSFLQKLIQFLLGKMERDPETRSLYLADAKKILQDHHKGQEDCWSCAGSDDFDRLEAIVAAGQGQKNAVPSVRKPLGLEGLLEHGDDAYQNAQFDEARRFYSEVMQILDERDLTDESTLLDDETLSRIQNRCLELECRQ